MHKKYCLLLALLLLLPLQLRAGTVSFSMGGASYNLPVTSYKEARFKNVIKQQYDFSCGSAALASLLTFHYLDEVTEKDVFSSMYAAGDKEKIKIEGFSLLDMKIYLEERGYRANGYKVNLDKLHQKAGVPAIALINTNGYNHFVVIKGVTSQEVLVGDPALGAKVVPRDVFERAWNGLAFIIQNKIQQGRKNYNVASDWEVRAKAPFGTALGYHSLAEFTIMLPQALHY